MSAEASRTDDQGARIRPIIERSWMRSDACGVDRGADLQLPYDEDIDTDGRLIRSARPVIERLVSTLVDTPHSVLLADSDARIIHRWVGTTSLYGRLDSVNIAPGFGFTEEHAGTNGVGTALEESGIVTVQGAEHFAQPLRSFACVGVPIRNPIRGGIEGVLDFSCLAKDFNPLMTTLLVEVAKHIETRFGQQASAPEAALLECFVRTSRGSRGPVIGMRPNMFLTNTAAAEQVDVTDQAILWDVASTYARRGRDEGLIELTCGRFSFRMTLVEDRSAANMGVVLRLYPEKAISASGGRDGVLRTEVNRPPRQVRSPRPTSGRSPQWKKVLDRIETLAAVDEPVAFTGGEGSGKLWAARRLAMIRGGELRILDPEYEPGSVQNTLIDRSRRALAAGESVVIRRIDKLTVPARAELGRLVRESDGPVRLIVTCTDDPRDTLVRALARFPHQIWLPPLAQRLDDIADIVPGLLAELETDRVVSCALPAQQMLMRYPWPGNVAELRDVLAGSLSEVRGSQIDVADLPPWLIKRAHRRQLTPYEQSERDLIIDTLASVGHNRTEAARVLGIGRATLYRKLRALGIPDGRHLTA